MKIKIKTKKLFLGAIIGMALISIMVAANSKGELLTGNLRGAADCNYKVENFDPNPATSFKYGNTTMDFKYQGPGCSKYKFDHFNLCFGNSLNTAEVACLLVKPTTNHYALTQKDWAVIDHAMKTKNTVNGSMELNWYVQANFGNLNLGEVQQSSPWTITFTK